jgi:tetratricopeptide (TPR) repeat protein
LQRYPNLAPLHFALGNFHAGQQRWSEAQSAYFDALLHANRDTLNPVSPDYAFNLAVSLEQLQQPQAALNYYRQALSLSRSSPPGFDPALLQSRLEILEQAQP